VSEGQTWSSEDTRLLVSKYFLARARNSICLPSLRSALTAAAFSEAEHIVFAAEGLFLAHDFPFYCGIRDKQRKEVLRHALIPPFNFAQFDGRPKKFSEDVLAALAHSSYE
jgi:hypothetical protein